MADHTDDAELNLPNNAKCNGSFSFFWYYFHFSALTDLREIPVHYHAHCFLFWEGWELGLRTRTAHGPTTVASDPAQRFQSRA